LSIERRTEDKPGCRRRSVCLPRRSGATVRHPSVFLNPKDGWLVVSLGSNANFSYGILYATSDGGATWSKIGELGHAAALSSLSHGWTVGGHKSIDVTGNDQLYSTDDGGQTWRPASVAPPAQGGDLVEPEIVGRDVWVLLAAGSLYRTGDAGATWTQDSVASLPGPLFDISFASPEAGWVIQSDECPASKFAPPSPCTSTSRLLATTDGGDSFHPLSPP